MKTLVHMLEHNFWGNTELLQSLIEQNELKGETERLMRHIAAAEQVWLLRLMEQSSAHVVLWADSPVEGQLPLAEQLEENEAMFREWMKSLTEEKLDSVLHYANQSGAPQQSITRDILTHLALHGQYHRGQINRELRQRGAKPVALDYIVYQRKFLK